MQYVMWVTAFWLSSISAVTAQRIWYVRAAAANGGTGGNWEQAFSQLTDALRVAKAGDAIHIATGTYRAPQTERLVAFRLPAGITLRGGFQGQSITELPDPVRYPTRLLGEVIAPGSSSMNLCVLTVEGTSTLPTVLMGLVFAYASSGTSAVASAAGIWIPEQTTLDHLLLRHCIFENLVCTGAAVAIEGRVKTLRWASCAWLRNKVMGSLVYLKGNVVKAVSVDSCRFLANQSGLLLDMQAIEAGVLGKMDVSHCFFESNHCTQAAFRTEGSRVTWFQDTMWRNVVAGALMEPQNTQPGLSEQRVVNCWFQHNAYSTWFVEAPSRFGLSDNAHLSCVQSAFTRNRGLLYRSPSTKINKTKLTAEWHFCTFADNVKGLVAGADSTDFWLDIRRIDSVRFNSCILADTLGDGVLCASDQSVVQLRHSLLATFSQQQVLSASRLHLDWGPGNLTQMPPMFVDTAQGNYRLQPCSPAIDAGDGQRAAAEHLAFDLQAKPRQANRAPDVGAWETARFIRRDSIQHVDCSAEGGVVIYSGQYCPPLHYEWTMGGTGTKGESPTQLAPGTYVFTVTDAMGIVLHDTVQVLADAQFKVESEVTYPSAPTFTNGGIRLYSPSGGSPPYRVRWNTGSTSPQLTDLLPNVYTATVTDAKNCRLVKIFDLRLTATSTPVMPTALRMHPNPVVCGGQLYFAALPEKMQISVWDIQGRLWTRTIATSPICSIAAPIEAGWYWVHFVSDTNHWVQKLRVQ